ncbi:S8 family peptidase [Myxococcaceae bacterium JPH2]|nr:S8 family peptidase [Myxococcaceae bacterium JPH2]
MRIGVGLVLMMLSVAGTSAAQPSKGDLPQGTSSPLIRSNNRVPGQYIIVLKDPQPGIAAQETSAVATNLASRFGGRVTFTYEHALRGFAAQMSDAQARAMASDAAVQYVEEDSYVRADELASQSSPPYGLDRIDQRDLPLDGYYRYMTGSTVNAYIVDTGVRTTHVDFEGRATADFTVIDDGYGAGDCNGHGTHVAATVGGETYGVAKDVLIHSVRVLDCSGVGTVAGVVAGVDWVTTHFVAPAVANVSIGGVTSQAIDDAVRRSVGAGVVYVVSAGNDGVDACQGSPARVAEAITVGAVDRADVRPSFSNWGGCVDLFAPGVDILSASNSDDQASRVLSGTSMAAPHVTGAVARYLAMDRGATPAKAATALLANSTQARVLNAGWGTPNRLVYVGFTGGMLNNGSPMLVGNESLNPSVGEVQFFYFDVPAGYARLDFFMSGGSGDANMYVRNGDFPSRDVYACRPFVGGSTESCTFSNPAAGRWYVMIDGYSRFAGVYLGAVYSNPLQNGVPVVGIGSTFFPRFYTLNVPAGKSGVRFDTSEGSGSADVYAKIGGMTMPGADCVSAVKGTVESCLIHNPLPGTAFVEVSPAFWRHGFWSGGFSYSNVTLVGTYY